MAKLFFWSHRHHGPVRVERGFVHLLFVDAECDERSRMHEATNLTKGGLGPRFGDSRRRDLIGLPLI